MSIARSSLPVVRCICSVKNIVQRLKTLYNQIIGDLYFLCFDVVFTTSQFYSPMFWKCCVADNTEFTVKYTSWYIYRHRAWMFIYTDIASAIFFGRCSWGCFHVKYTTIKSLCMFRSGSQVRFPSFYLRCTLKNLLGCFKYGSVADNSTNHILIMRWLCIWIGWAWCVVRCWKLHAWLHDEKPALEYSSPCRAFVFSSSWPQIFAILAVSFWGDIILIFPRIRAFCYVVTTSSNYGSCRT